MLHTKFYSSVVLTFALTLLLSLSSCFCCHASNDGVSNNNKNIAREGKQQKQSFLRRRQLFMNDNTAEEERKLMPAQSSSSNGNSSNNKCGCSTCTEDVLNTDADGYSCGSRIDWVINNMDGYSEEDACNLIGGEEFSSVCGGCHTAECNDDRDINEQQRCGGCKKCTESVWNTLVTDGGGTYSCGDRIEWVKENLIEDGDEEDACRVVTEDFPDACTCTCDDDDDVVDDDELNSDNNNDDDDDEGNESLNIRAVSLNVYGYRTMPQAANEYANKIKQQDPDIVGIQEGVNDWKIDTKYPTDYSRANALLNALGDCWDSRYQIFINTCKGNEFVSNERFDLSDGQDATRTGEAAIITKDDKRYKVVNVHWEAFSSSVRDNNAAETADEVNKDDDQIPTITIGDFNSPCTGSQVSSFSSRSGSSLVADGGIDCVLTKGNFEKVVGTTFNASPSDHPGVIAGIDLVAGYVADPSPQSNQPVIAPPTQIDMCGCPSCNQVLDSDADGSTCKNRIEWVIANRGFSEADACSLVADEYPTICGSCHATHCGSSFPPPPPTTPVSSGAMVKVMSYNTEYKGYQDGRVPSFGAKIREIQADAVGVQECQDPDELAAQSGYALLTGTGTQNYILYNADRLQPIDSGTMNIPRDDYSPRTLTWGKFRIHAGSGVGNEFWFFNTHLPHRHNEAGDPNTHAKIGRMLLAKRRELGADNAPTVVVGDCNPFASAGANEGSFESNLAAGGIVKIYEATGSTGGYGGLDKIFASVDHWTGSNGADVGTGRSDHPAIAADLSLK